MVEPTQRPAQRERVEFSELEVLVSVMASPRFSTMLDMVDGGSFTIHHHLKSISEQAIHPPPSSVLSTLSSLPPLIAMAWTKTKTKTMIKRDNDKKKKALQTLIFRRSTLSPLRGATDDVFVCAGVCVCFVSTDLV